MFERPVTIQYPEVKRPVSSRFRGRHELRRFDNGLEKGIGCSLCSAADAGGAGRLRPVVAGDQGPGLGFAMTIDQALFFGLAAVAVWPAACMLLSRNAVYSALFLVLNFMTVAVFFLLLHAAFIALMQVTEKT